MITVRTPTLLLSTSILLSTLICQPALAAPTICRGGNAPIMARAVKQAVESKLAAANISYSRVAVTIKANDRRATKLPSSYDFTEQVTVTSEPLAIDFQGSLPAPVDCELPATMRIKVFSAGALLTESTESVVIKGSQLLRR